MPTFSLQLCGRGAAFGIALFAASGFADEGSRSPAISDDAAIFRQHAQLKAELEEEAKTLSRDTGVITLLKTVAFATGDTTANHARRLAEATTHSDDTPVVAVLYVRGNRSAGIGSNAPFDAIVPAFEIASLPSRGSDGNSDAAEQIAETFRRLLMLIRRYTSDIPQTDANHPPADAGTAERWLWAATLTVSTAIVGISARFSRSKKPSL